MHAPERICRVDDCDKPRKGKNRTCSMHLARLSRRGTTDPGPRSPAPVAERYERYVVRNLDGCWGWTGATNGRGYSQLGVGRSHVYGHRLSYEIHHGVVPSGLFVLHRCDNPPCTNPAHLFVGTHSDNMRDAIYKGRRGTLTVDQVVEIRRLRAAGVTYRVLAPAFGISESNVGMIVNRQTWKGV